ncbi:MAG: HIRAN domain-containing protein [Waterburya sp.]
MNPKKIQTLFLAWQDYTSRVWFPIGRLTFDGIRYQFVYIKGAKDAEQRYSFQPLISFPQWNEVYYSTHLFPVFANRLMSRSRPEYPSFVERLNISLDEDDPMVLLARSEGKRETDSLTVFPCPEPDESGKYELNFFAHGLRYLPEGAISKIEQFQVGDRLWLAHESQNEYDKRALTLHTPDHYIVGYCPRYLLSNVFDILMRSPQLVEVRVERINQFPTPLKFRLLCKMVYSTLDDVQPFSQEEYQPIAREKSITL